VMGSLSDLADSVRERDGEPKADLAICSSCRRAWPVDGLETEEAGDYESGYFRVHICPKCEDGGLIEEYTMSEDRAREWGEWNASRENP